MKPSSFRARFKRVVKLNRNEHGKQACNSSTLVVETEEFRVSKPTLSTYGIQG